MVTFFNELDPEKNLSEKAVMYIFSKFGLVSEIKYAEHGQVFISFLGDRTTSVVCHEDRI